MGSVLENSTSHQIKNCSNNRRIYIMRHGERVDLVFGSFTKHCFDTDGKYMRLDLNMPEILPRRKNLSDWQKDSPLTNVGIFQASLIGEGIKLSGDTISQAYTSPMYRCIQTCDATLRALGLQEKVKIRIEPALFEWSKFYPEGLPEFFTPQELKDLGYNIDLDYVPNIPVETLKTLDEDFEFFYQRNASVSESIAQKTDTGNVLIVGHGSNLETGTRFLLKKPLRTTKDMSRIMFNVGFCSLLLLEEIEQNNWKMIEPPLSQITHSKNARFDWQIFNS